MTLRVLRVMSGLHYIDPLFYEKPTKPLHIAARDGDLEEVTRLIAHGADPFEKDEFGKRPVDWAVILRYIDGVNMDVVDLFYDLEEEEAEKQRTRARLEVYRHELMKKTWHPSRLYALGYFDTELSL